MPPRQTDRTGCKQHGVHADISADGAMTFLTSDFQAKVMQVWTQFYGAIATASAALLGLLFVAVSINVAAALGAEDAVSGRLTEQAFQNYLAVMMVSLLALFPGMDTTTFGAVTLVATAGWSIWVFIRFWQTVAQRQEPRLWAFSVRRHVSSLIGFGILLAAAFRMAVNWGTSYNWVAASMLVLLFSATTVSWELLKRIANRGSG